MMDEKLESFLLRSGLIQDADTPVVETLPGGVSSDIWVVRTSQRAFCVKRALPTLKTQKAWHAPIERNANEVKWIRTAMTVVPKSVPKILAEDSKFGIFAMEYLDPNTYPIWKAQLLEGVIEPQTAGAVGTLLGQIHANTAHNADIAKSFANDDIFHALRIEPYLLRTAKEWPEIAHKLEEMAINTARTKFTLVHGDISPKNILIGPEGPVLLDAECAWSGDPAFALAFCLNHLVLKSVLIPVYLNLYMESFVNLAAKYLPHVGWEDPEELERRTAKLLPALMLARIDGASPVEYLTDKKEKEFVRELARRGILKPHTKLTDIAQMVQDENTV